MKLKITSLFILFNLNISIIAQSDTTSSDSLKHYSLDEIEIVSTKYEVKKEELAVPVEVTDKEEMFISSSSTPSDILQKEAGLSVSRDGVWGTFTSVRGLSKNNIVSLVNGNRIETANDIAASLSLIDVNDISRIEVLKSASSSLYGSGALGGVVNIITNNGFYPESFRLNISSLSSYNSVNGNSSGTLSLNAGSQNWFINFRGTLRNASDTKTPEGILNNSQFRNKSYSANSGIKFLNNQEIEFSYQNFIANDVGIPGNTLFTPNAEVKYLKAERKLATFEYIIKNPVYSCVKLNAKFFYQEIQRDLENKPFLSSLNNNGTTRVNVLKITPSGNHKTLSGSIQSDWIFGNHFIITGIELWQRQLLTSRERKLLIENIDTVSNSVINSINKIIGEKPIPDSKYLSIGFYSQDEFQIVKNKLKLTIGGRIDQIQVENEEAFNPLYEITSGVINNNPQNRKIIWQKENADDFSWSTNINILYKIFNDVNVTFSAAKSFRSPSLEERFQYIDQSGLIRIGNPDLEPEQGYFFDAGLRILLNDFTLTGDMFFNQLTNLVSEVRGTFEGRQAFIKTNIGKARLYGFDFSFQYSFLKDYSLSGVMSIVNGEDIQNKDYLPQIPPLNGNLSFNFKPIELLKISISSTFFADQNKTAPGEARTPGYIVFNLSILSSSFDIGFSKIQIASGIDNITNRSYRNHLSSYRGIILIEPARNYYIKIKLDI